MNETRTETRTDTGSEGDPESRVPVRDFRRALRLLERQVERTLASQTGCCGVTVAQCHLLLELDQAEFTGSDSGAGSGAGPDRLAGLEPGLGVGDCARALELDASTLSRTVDSLVKSGLVSRKEDANNRRRQIVALTEAGRARVAGIHSLCDSYYGRILDSFPQASRKILAEGITALAAALRSQPFDGCASAPDARGTVLQDGVAHAVRRRRNGGQDMNRNETGNRGASSGDAGAPRGLIGKFTPLTTPSRGIAAKPSTRASEKPTARTDEESFRRSFVIGRIEREGRAIPVVDTRLSASDRAGSVKVRWGIGRNSYRVRPGIYATGAPGAESPVFVTANYKFSFDSLRSALSGVDAWLLVLDTKGVNVWCAAGKGSFGTAELVARIAKTALSELVSHRKLILPQLGAPGVSARDVARKSGFAVIYGPVRASDIHAWLKAGMKKDESMRTVRFGLADRLALAPLELVHAWPFILAAVILAIPAAFLSRLAPSPGAGASGVQAPSFLAVWATVSGILSGGIVAGTVGVPALLHFLPFRAFSIKGAALGALWGVAASLVSGARPAQAFCAALVCGAVSAWFGMNFTGCSTFTSQTGALDEVEKGFVPMIACAVAGILLGGIALAVGF